MKDRFFDNTRVQEFRVCPRKYYFRHVIDLVPSGRWSPPLVFGSSWHAAMDTLWPLVAKNAPKMGDQEVVNAAYENFLDTWIDQGAPHPDDMTADEIKDLEPRTPFNAKEMLYEYLLQRRTFISDCEMLAVEKPFAVPLDPNNPDLFYVGRLDKVVRKGKNILIPEHKTTTLYSVKGIFRNTFLDQFSPNSQVDGYLHGGHMVYGDDVKAVWIDGALVHKKVHDGFIFIPVERQTSQLDAWLWETRYFIDQIEGNWAAYEDEKERGGPETNAYMAAFPKCTNSCQDFARNCPYIDLCKSWSNPMGRETPAGYVQDPWSPFDRLELDKIGMVKGEGDARNTKR